MCGSRVYVGEPTVGRRRFQNHPVPDSTGNSSPPPPSPSPTPDDLQNMSHDVFEEFCDMIPKIFRVSTTRKLTKTRTHSYK